MSRGALNFLGSGVLVDLALGMALIVFGAIWLDWSIRVVTRPDVPVRVERDDAPRSDR